MQVEAGPPGSNAFGPMWPSEERSLGKELEDAESAENQGPGNPTSCDGS